MSGRQLHLRQSPDSEHVDVYAVEIDGERPVGFVRLGRFHPGDDRFSLIRGRSIDDEERREVRRLLAEQAGGANDRGDAVARKVARSLNLAAAALEGLTPDQIAAHATAVLLALSDVRAVVQNRLAEPAADRSAHAALAVAEQRARDGDWEGAERLARRAADEAGDDWRALRLLSTALLHQSKLEQALKIARRALGARPQWAPSHAHVGHVLRALGRHKQSVGAFRAAVRLDPADVALHQMLILSLRDAGETGPAVAAAREAVRRHPAEPVAHFLLGSLLADGRETLEEARRAIEAALELRPLYAEAADWLDRVNDRLAAVPAHPRERRSG